MLKRLDTMPRKELIQLALHIRSKVQSDRFTADTEIFDPLTDEQLRLYITQKALELMFLSYDAKIVIGVIDK